jgi:hypothetical protein
MTNNLASQEPAPERTGAVALMAAVHHALGCPARQLPGTVAVIRAVLAVALDDPEPSYPHLIAMVETGTRRRGSS